MKSDPVARFWSSVAKGEPDECWLWQKYVAPNGYGHFRERSYVRVYAHRYSYELEYGPIPKGLTIDHLCVTRSCVNPLHLDVCSGAENTRRGKTRRKTCRNGLHDLTAPNAWHYVKSNGSRNGSRYCRLCRLATERRRKRHA